MITTVVNSSCLHERDTSLRQSKLQGKLFSPVRQNCFLDFQSFPFRVILWFYGRDQVQGFYGTLMRSGERAAASMLQQTYTKCLLCVRHYIQVKPASYFMTLWPNYSFQFQSVLLIKGDCPLLATFHETLKLSCLYHLSPSFFLL